jgi:hypothetical protein
MTKVLTIIMKSTKDSSETTATMRTIKAVRK